MADKNLFTTDLPPDEVFRLKNGRHLSEEKLKAADEDTQTDAMRMWFFSRFQNPVEETPYNSQEGGYQYLYGGPYDAGEQIESRFEGIVSQEVREKLVAELESESSDWAGLPRDSDYDDYFEQGGESASEHENIFTAGTATIRKLLTATVNASERQFFLRMVYASVITVLETYLSNRFIYSLKDNPGALRKFVETFPLFQKEAMKTSDVFRKTERLERRCHQLLRGEVMWHRLMVVRQMYLDTFDVQFPEPNDLKDLLRAVDIRHDLVHRSGENKDGIENTITPEMIEKLISEAARLVTWIDVQGFKFEAVKDEKKDPPEEITF